jgi:hypothetical protein
MHVNKDEAFPNEFPHITGSTQNTVFTLIKYHIHPIYCSRQLEENLERISVIRFQTGLVNEARGYSEPQAIWSDELLFVVGFGLKHVYFISERKWHWVHHSLFVTLGIPSEVVVACKESSSA